MQSFIETAAENARAGHVVPKKKYTEGRNCEFLNAEVVLLGPLYRSSALFGRKTNVWLGELTVNKDNTFPMRIVIKIFS